MSHPKGSQSSHPISSKDGAIWYKTSHLHGPRRSVICGSQGHFLGINSESSGDLLSARESVTINYFKSIGVNENVYLVADPAFLMDPVKPEEIEEDLPLMRSRSV